MTTIQRSTITLRTIATTAPQRAHVKLLCSRRISRQEGTRIYTDLPIPICPRELTTQACPARLDAHHIIQTHIPTMNVPHSPLRPLIYHLQLEWEAPNTPNCLLSPITMFHNWTEHLLDHLAQPIRTSQDLLEVIRGKQECRLDRLAQPIQTSQDLLEATRGKQNHLRHPTAILQSLLELTIYPQLDLKPHLQQPVRRCRNLGEC